MPSKEEVRKAFALFDANGDGIISLQELKAILCRPTPLQPPLSEARAEQIMRQLDTNGDGQLSMDELAAGWATLPISLVLAAASLELKAEKQGAHSDCVQSVAFSPDGKTIVSGSSDKTLKVWDAGAWALIPLNPHAQN